MRLPGQVRPEPFFFALLALIWGSSYVAIGIVGDGVGPLTLVATRLLIGTLALAGVVAALRIPRPRLGQLPRLGVASLLGIVIPFSLITWSERSVDAGLASIMVAAAPLVSAVLVATTTRDEQLGRLRLAGLGLGFLGVVVVAGGGIDGGGDPLAIAALLGAAVSYAANGAWSRRQLAGISPLTAAFGQAVSGLVMVGALALATEPLTSAVPSATAIAALAWLGLLSSGVAPLLYFRLVASWGATRTTMVNYLTPVVGVVAAVLVLGERLGPMAIAGGVLVMAGVALANLTIRRPIRSIAAGRPQGARRAALPVQRAPIARSPVSAAI